MRGYVENMKKYEEIMQKNEGNMKKYERIMQKNEGNMEKYEERPL